MLAGKGGGKGGKLQGKFACATGLPALLERLKAEWSAAA
jgi:hypothetical protein